MIIEGHEIVLCRDIGEIAMRAAESLVDIAESSISERGRFAVALSGGSTPGPLYELLAGGGFRWRIDWGKVLLFWGDERCVGPEDDRSNYRMVRESLIKYIDIPPGNIHRIKGEECPGSAESYGDDIKRTFGLEAGELPVFDLILLGMGEDGHTASLFPESPVLKESDRLAAMVHRPGSDLPRITLTPPVICNGRNISVLVSGEKKAGTLYEVLIGEIVPEKYPAQIVRLSKGGVKWFVDVKAAGMLTA